MKNKLILVLLAVLMAQGVYALGITPARTTMEFSPGLEREVSFTIINSEHKDAQIVVYAQGELNQSILINQNSLSMASGEESKQLSYSVKLPDSLSPGLHRGEVVVLQLPSKSSTSEAFVGAAVGVATQLHVYVPYPGKYAEADLNIVNAENGGEATFIIPVVSRGELDLADVKANIDIYNKMGEKVTTFNTLSIEVKSGERREIVHKWKADVPVGAYRAVATLIYDGENLQLERQFLVGSQALELQQVQVKDFTLGEIAKFEMLIENKWSEPITGAFAQTNVFNAEGKVMADFKSPVYDIAPLSKTTMILYWDTAGVREGMYDASVYLRYGEKSSQQDVKLNVREDNIEVTGLGYVISEKGGTKSGGSGSLVIILIVVIVVLVLINLSWFLFFRKKLAGKGQKGGKV